MAYLIEMNAAVVFISFLFLFAAVSWFLSWSFSKGYTKTKSALLVANRKLGLWESSLSVAASWIWAPALFISSQKAYQDGYLGLFWFVTPNVVCLLIFAYAAVRVRKDLPQGFSLSQFVLEKTSKRVQNLYWISLSGLAICAFAVQLLAGGQFLSDLTGIPFFWLTLILSAIPLSYSLVFGLKATVITDYAKMIFIYIIGFSLIPYAISAGGVDALVRGLGGVNQIFDPFGGDSLKLFLTFGLPTTIGLLSGPFGDQTFWQRLFATEEKVVRRAFFQSAVLFGVVPLLLSTLGFLAAGLPIKIKNPQLVNLETVTALLPPWATLVFSFMILAGLISILDSKLAAIGSLGGHDWINRKLGIPGDAPFARVLRSSRLSMIALAISAIGIANIPGLKILHLFLFYGTLRSATLLPTLFLIFKVKVSEKGVFWGILVSMLVGLPIFAYGNLMSLPSVIVAGSLFTVLASGVCAKLFPK